MRPKKASPILNKNMKASIPNPIDTPFFLKKLNSGFNTVPINHAASLEKELFPILSAILLSSSFCCLKRSSFDSGIKFKPILQRIMTIVKIINVICQ